MLVSLPINSVGLRKGSLGSMCRSSLGPFSAFIILLYPGGETWPQGFWRVRGKDLGVSWLSSIVAFYFGVEVCDPVLLLSASVPNCISPGLVFSLVALSVRDDE